MSFCSARDESTPCRFVFRAGVRMSHGPDALDRGGDDVVKEIVIVCERLPRAGYPHQGAALVDDGATGVLQAIVEMRPRRPETACAVLAVATVSRQVRGAARGLILGSASRYVGRREAMRAVMN